MIRVEPQPNHISNSFVADLGGVSIRLMRLSCFGWQAIKEKLDCVLPDDKVNNIAMAILLRLAWAEPSIEWEHAFDPDEVESLTSEELAKVGAELWAEMNSRKSAKVFPVMAWLTSVKTVKMVIGASRDDDDPND